MNIINDSAFAFCTKDRVKDLVDYSMYHPWHKTDGGL